MTKILVEELQNLCNIFMNNRAGSCIYLYDKSLMHLLRHGPIIKNELFTIKVDYQTATKTLELKNNIIKALNILLKKYKCVTKVYKINHKLIGIEGIK